MSVAMLFDRNEMKIRYCTLCIVPLIRTTNMYNEEYPKNNNFLYHADDTKSLMSSSSRPSLIAGTQWGCNNHNRYYILHMIAMRLRFVSVVLIREYNLLA